MEKKKLALLGCGYLNQIVGDAVKSGILQGYDLVGVMGRNPEKVKEVSEKYNCKPCTTIEELIALEPDFVAEAASNQAVLDYGEKIVKSGVSIVLLSTSTLLDSDFFERLENAAAEKGVNIYLPGGLVGGLDLLHTASIMNPIEASLTSKKSEDRFSGFIYIDENETGNMKSKTASEGQSKVHMDQHPEPNHAIIPTSYANNGPNHVDVHVDFVADFKGYDHKIQAKGPEVEIEVEVVSENHKFAAWSVVQTLQNAIATVVI
ncbi:hypothetical protein LZ578_02420 [Jeotgalibaca sp. MA1X17-3]|uniref:hypothetical protein n=1 Tax=Jeotgalibaca sp. MA1X17-3 TaxID=2908211 RepID=UPI001F3F59E3|nr:hypothetical protein [Jeotgalibaca sp. MA1X17-3]UJF16018.1 hypothetical protein LZ578_02420 [Jeotgalibaca sp. MA1X17-3]